MDAQPSLFSALSLRRMFGGSNALLERRVRDLPVMIDRRTGPACENCGFGTLHLVPDGVPDAGKLRCDRPGCGKMSEKTPAASTT